MLAAQAQRHNRSKTPDHKAFSVDHDPPLLDFGGLCNKGGHGEKSSLSMRQTLGTRGSIHERPTPVNADATSESSKMQCVALVVL
jgi:hypothetical protein